MAHRARLRGATSRLRSGAEAGRTPCQRGSGQEELPMSESGVVARKSFPMPEVRGGGQGVVATKEWWLCGHRKA